MRIQYVFDVCRWFISSRIVFDNSDAFTNRFVLLGASNLTLSLRLIIHRLQQRLGGPSEVLAAVGHGRAYGLPSQALGRGLPSITDCDVWHQLEYLPVRPTYALLTDIGNDILYGSSSQQVLQSVSWCVAQLQRHGAQVVVTNLPLAAIERLSVRRYLFYRKLFYPSSSLSRDEALRCVGAVHLGLRELAWQQHFLLHEQHLQWFGADGIHVRYRLRSRFYRDIVASFPLVGNSSSQSDRYRDDVQPWQRRARFAYKTLLGREVRCTQPSGRLADGSIVFKY